MGPAGKRAREEGPSLWQLAKEAMVQGEKNVAAGKDEAAVLQKHGIKTRLTKTGVHERKVKYARARKRYFDAEARSHIPTFLLRVYVTLLTLAGCAKKSFNKKSERQLKEG